jgi:hypothetical protein
MSTTNENNPLGKAHYAIQLQAVAEKFALPGEVVRTWIEHDTQYLHVVTAGPAGSDGGPFVEVPVGGYIELSEMPGNEDV